MRRAGRILLAALLIGGAGLLAWTPTSPFGIDRANEAYLRGDATTAARIYQEVASGWGPQSTRAIAAERAGILHLHAREDTAAVHWLRVAMSLSGGEDRVRIETLLGFVYISRFDDPRRAGEVYEAAADETEASGGLRVEAARAYSRAEAWEDAGRAWSRALPALTDPTARAEAEAALLRAAQHQGPDAPEEGAD